VIVETPVNLSKAQLKKFEEFTQSLAGEEHHPIKESFTKAANHFHNK
jgi:DnaJ-class molecular chaperone